MWIVYEFDFWRYGIRAVGIRQYQRRSISYFTVLPLTPITAMTTKTLATWALALQYSNLTT
jgi:hypothetical protein